MTSLVVAVTATEVLAAGRLVAVVVTPEDREGQLLLDARRRPEAFGELYELTERKIVAFFYRRTACAATAADLTSETYASALRGLRRFDPDRGTGIGYLFGIANNLLLQWQRREQVEQSARRRLGMRVDVAASAAVDDIEELVDFDALKEPLALALDDLTAGVRDAVKLRIFEELEYDEVASRLGCSPGTARVRVSRGLSRLGRRLGAP